MNLSICNMDRYGIHIQFDIKHYFTSMKISTECIRWYTPEAMGTVSLLTNIVHGVHYIRLYLECVCQYIPETMRTVPLLSFSVTMFTVFITQGYIDGMCSLEYSSDHVNYSLINELIIFRGAFC